MPSDVKEERLTPKTLGGLKVEAVADIEPSFNMLVYGEPGAGKTVLAGSADALPDLRPVVCIDVEGGSFSLRNTYPDVQIIRVTTWKQMQDVYDELYRMKHGYKTVIVDSLTEVQKFSMMQIMKDLVKDKPERDPDIASMQEWGKNIEQTRKFIRAFRDLPLNTIFTALAMGDKNPKTGKVLTLPSLSGKLAREAAGFVDIVAYMYVKMVDGEPQRLLLTSQTEDIIAKDRSGRLPQVVQEPTMETIMNYVTGDGNGNQG